MTEPVDRSPGQLLSGMSVNERDSAAGKMSGSLQPISEHRRGFQSKRRLLGAEVLARPLQIGGGNIERGVSPCCRTAKSKLRKVSAGRNSKDNCVLSAGKDEENEHGSIRG